ncbi:palmitoyltransferase ZDHHC23-like [Babylonia areolata]|uniref:palmitoyltransferase ZDHHC23-like n=1 Tax=Babylonia areolata TaxID=304850 RepID=UPI003FD2575E
MSTNTGSAGSEPLCCCEYQNEAGERSHLLACCCDCQALDEACDRLLTCRAVPTTTMDRLLSTVADRCRVPSFLGQGALKVRVDVVTPVLVVPTCLLFASLGPTATLLAFVFMPAFLLLFYQVWRRQGHGRTPFFFSWGLTSVITCYLVFQSLVVSFREVLLWEILLQFSSTAAMLYMLYKTKGDPGILRSGEQSSRGRSKRHCDSPLPNGATVLYDQASGRAVSEGRPLYDKTSDTAIQIDSSSELDAAMVKWVDSRPIRGGKLMSWCSSCSFKRPPRAGHCTVCDACIAVRDHHCVWIDHCVGANNHRSFVAAMALFVWCGLYGSHLTFTSICTPVMVYDWFLLPSDCRFLYQNFYTSMSFVCGAYTLLATAVMVVALLYQVALISQNVTSQELHTSLARGMARCWLFPAPNVNSQGLLRNWLEFLLLPARSASPKIPS